MTVGEPASTAPGTGRRKGNLRLADSMQAGLLEPGDVVYAKTRPDLRAKVVDAALVALCWKQWRYNDWGMQVTGWSAINIYREVVLDRTGQTLEELRKQVR